MSFWLHEVPNFYVQAMASFSKGQPEWKILQPSHLLKDRKQLDRETGGVLFSRMTVTKYHQPFLSALAILRYLKLSLKENPTQ
jgi:hypothetical protein